MQDQRGVFLGCIRFQRHAYLHHPSKPHALIITIHTPFLRIQTALAMICNCVNSIGRGFAGALSTLRRYLSALKKVLRVEPLTVASVLGAPIVVNGAISPAAA